MATGRNGLARAIAGDAGKPGRMGGRCGDGPWVSLDCGRVEFAVAGMAVERAVVRPLFVMEGLRDAECIGKEFLRNLS